MGRIIKVVAIVAGALVVLVVAVLAGVALLFDPNDYKDDITVAVGNATGRSLTLEGDLGLSLFPRIGITLGAAELSNAPGFGDAPFARFDSAELYVGLLPLLSRRVEIDRAMLSGLRLNFARDAQGRTNWDDLGQGGGAAADDGAADAQDTGAGADVDISVGAIEILDAEVAWRDASTGQDWTLSNFNLTASDFDPGQAFPLRIGFDLGGAEVSVTVDASMQASVRLAQNQYRLDDLSVELSGEGPGWPGGSGVASLEFASLAADLDAQTVALEELRLEMLGVAINGTLDGENLLDDLSLRGGIEIEEFDPRELMAAFDTSIETADPGVLNSASASAEFYFDSQAMGMREMALRLDDSTLSGSAGLRGERVEFELTVDAIDIDRYLPPPAEGDEDLPDDTGSVDEIDLPIEPLRNFSANGKLALNEARFLGLTLTDANFALAAANGRMTVTPTATLYGGSLEGQIGIEVQGENARLSLRTALANVDMAGVARDYLKIETLTGTGNVSLDLAAVGSKVGTIKRDLDGRASVAITDGAILEVDVWQEIMELRARLTGPDAPPAPTPVQTAFDRIAVGGPVEDAVMTTEEFTAVLPFAALNGSGTIDLLTTELDLRANAGLVDGPTLQQDPVLAEYAGGTIPLRITGTLDSPRPLPDVQALLSQAVQRRVEEEVDEAVDEAVDEVEERLRDRLRNILE